MLVLSKTSEAWWQLLSEGSSHYSNGNIKAERADERAERPQITLFTGNNSNPFIIRHGPRVTKSVTIITLYCADNRKQRDLRVIWISSLEIRQLFSGGLKRPKDSTSIWRNTPALYLSPVIQHCSLLTMPSFWEHSCEVFSCPTIHALHRTVHVNRDCMFDSCICISEWTRIGNKVGL